MTTTKSILFAILALAPWQGARAQTESAPPVQIVGLADAKVQASQPVALKLKTEALENTRAALLELTESQGHPPVAGPSATLIWLAPGQKPRYIPVEGPLTSLPIAPRTTGSFEYYVELRDAAGQFQLRLPAEGRNVRLEVTAEPGPVVLAGPGDEEAVYGERIPVSVTIADPDRVSSAILRHRTRGETEWSSTAMNRKESAAEWAASVPRPLGEGTGIDYHVVITDAAGRTTSYGSASKPYHLKILAPPPPMDVGQ